MYSFILSGVNFDIPRTNCWKADIRSRLRLRFSETSSDKAGLGETLLAALQRSRQPQNLLSALQNQTTCSYIQGHVRLGGINFDWLKINAVLSSWLPEDEYRAR